MRDAGSDRRRRPVGVGEQPVGARGWSGAELRGERGSGVGYYRRRYHGDRLDPNRGDGAATPDAVAAMVVVLPIVLVGVVRFGGVILMVGDRMGSVPIVVRYLRLSPVVLIKPCVHGRGCRRSHVRGAVERAQGLRRDEKEERKEKPCGPAA